MILSITKVIRNRSLSHYRCLYFFKKTLTAKPTRCLCFLVSSSLPYIHICGSKMITVLLGDCGAQSRGGGAQRKDSLKDKYSYTLGYTCHLHNTFLLRVLSSVDRGRWIDNLCLLTPPPFPLLPSPHPPALIWEHLGPPYHQWRHSFFGYVTITSVDLAFIHQIFI